MLDDKPVFSSGMGEPMDMLAEEAAEVIQVIMKYKRFGNNENSPEYKGPTAIEKLHSELGDLFAVLMILMYDGKYKLLDDEKFQDAIVDKFRRLEEYFGYHITQEMRERIMP